MKRTISQLKSDISGALHGTSINRVTNFFNILNSSLDFYFTDGNRPPETRDTYRFTHVPGIFAYPLPVSVSQGAIIDIATVNENRSSSDIKPNVTLQEFDTYKGRQNMFTTSYDEGVKSLLFSPGSSTVSETVFSGGTPVGFTYAGNDATSTVYEDKTYSKTGYAAIRMPVATGNTQLTATFAFSPTRDLTTYENGGVVVIRYYQDSLVSVSGITATIAGTVVAGENSLYSESKDEFNEVLFKIPLGLDLSAISDLVLTFTVALDGAGSSFVNIDKVFIANSSLYKVISYSSAIIEDKDTAGDMKKHADDDQDFIVLSDEYYSLFKDLVISRCFSQMNMESVGNDLEIVLARYSRQSLKLKAKNPTEKKLRQNPYYKFNK